MNFGYIIYNIEAFLCNDPLVAVRSLKNLHHGGSGL